MMETKESVVENKWIMRGHRHRALGWSEKSAQVGENKPKQEGCEESAM